MIKGKRLISGFLIGVMIISTVLTVGATDIGNMKKEQKELQEQRNEAASQEKSLAAKVQALSKSMNETEAKLGKKRAEIAETEQELVMAKMDESEQYESMKLRIRYMYENSNVNLVELFLESEGITDFLNKTEYIRKMSEYDRQKLDEFQVTVQKVQDKELLLQGEYQELQGLQESLEKQSREAKQLLATKTSELAKIDADLKKIRNQIYNAEAEAKKKAEADAAKNPSTGGSNSNSGGSSSSSQAKPPAVSGNKYFTHPCPGMSYQSSYFGEVRHGIGDTTPHKGHDYAARRGTPIYAAAAGTVLIAGWSDSAGYWVVISHGNGLVSKYMHMYQSPLVSAGQKVVKGQHIGGVGTTGQSTGNHLHFQVEVNGVAVNPSIYM
jgi:murein DD-endopeptidase MepM/ murein hydrolase activator NlpD